MSISPLESESPIESQGIQDELAMRRRSVPTPHIEISTETGSANPATVPYFSAPVHVFGEKIEDIKITLHDGTEPIEDNAGFQESTLDETMQAELMSGNAAVAKRYAETTETFTAIRTVADQVRTSEKEQAAADALKAETDFTETQNHIAQALSAAVQALVYDANILIERAAQKKLLATEQADADAARAAHIEEVDNAVLAKLTEEISLTTQHEARHRRGIENLISAGNTTTIALNRLKAAKTTAEESLFALRQGQHGAEKLKRSYTKAEADLGEELATALPVRQAKINELLALFPDKQTEIQKRIQGYDDDIAEKESEIKKIDEAIEPMNSRLATITANLTAHLAEPLQELVEHSHDIQGRANVLKQVVEGTYVESEDVPPRAILESIYARQPHTTLRAVEPNESEELPEFLNRSIPDALKLDPEDDSTIGDAAAYYVNADAAKAKAEGFFADKIDSPALDAVEVAMEAVKGSLLKRGKRLYVSLANNISGLNKGD